MKKTLLLLFILCAASAFGQLAGTIPSQANPMVIGDHVQHADIHDLAMEQPLVGKGPNTYTYAQGERPLWEFGPVSEPIALGDIAREVRKEKLTAKKAEIVFEKQGH